MAEELREAGLSLFREGKHEAALVALSKALFVDPEDADAYRHRADVYLELGDLRSALANYRKFQRVSGESLYGRHIGRVLFVLGQAQAEDGDFGAAVATFSEAIGRDKVQHAYYVQRALAHVGLEDLKAAVEDMTQAIVLEPTLADLYILRGRLHALLGDAVRAQKDIDQAQRLQPDHSACIQLRAEQQAKARVFLNRATDAQLSGDLDAALDASLDVLAPGARMAVISFHSLEDRLVKQFMAQHAKDAYDRRQPLAAPKALALAQVQRVLPSAAEVAANPRARSAVLRLAQRSALAWEALP